MLCVIPPSKKNIVSVALGFKCIKRHRQFTKTTAHLLANVSYEPTVDASWLKHMQWAENTIRTLTPTNDNDSQ